MQYEELPPEQRPIAGAEDAKDVGREFALETDGPVEKVARKYLRSCNRRIRIEFESGGKADAVLYLLVELMRARKFRKVAGIQIEDREIWITCCQRWPA